MLKHTSPGWDEVDSRVIKEVASEITEPLTHIINQSLITGQIPSELKLAKVTPIFKAGDAKTFILISLSFANIFKTTGKSNV